MAKQTASRRYFHVALADQFRYYLAPDFFLMGMLKYSSARNQEVTRFCFQLGERKGFLQFLDALFQLRILLFVLFDKN